jgi:hypothetical protein
MNPDSTSRSSSCSYSCSSSAALILCTFWAMAASRREGRLYLRVKNYLKNNFERGHRDEPTRASTNSSKISHFLTPKNATRLGFEPLHRLQYAKL